MRKRLVQSNENFKILIVDDNDMNIELVTEIMNYSGYKFDTAKNGIEAVKLHMDNKYSLILMDCNMPVMDGYEATNHIRAFENDFVCHTPIIAMTAYTSKEEQEKCFSAGMDCHIGKPININSLLDTVESYLNALTAV